MSECIFCKIVAGEIPSQKVYEDDLILVIKDVNPQAPIHDLVLSKKHVLDLNELEEVDNDLAASILLGVKKVADIEGISKNGYRLISNTGKNGGQLVPHLHFHILGGKRLGPKLASG